MASLGPTSYYQFREEQERAIAARTVNPAVANIHLEMADRYSKLVRTPRNRRAAGIAETQSSR